MSNEDEWLSVNDISAELHVSTESIRKHLNKPDGLPAHLVGNTYRIHRSDYKNWLARRRGRRKKT